MQKKMRPQVKQLGTAVSNKRTKKNIQIVHQGQGASLLIAPSVTFWIRMSFMEEYAGGLHCRQKNAHTKTHFIKLLADKLKSFWDVSGTDETKLAVLAICINSEFDYCGSVSTNLTMFVHVFILQMLIFVYTSQDCYRLLFLQASVCKMFFWKVHKWLPEVQTGAGHTSPLKEHILLILCVCVCVLWGLQRIIRICYCVFSSFVASPVLPWYFSVSETVCVHSQKDRLGVIQWSSEWVNVILSLGGPCGMFFLSFFFVDVSLKRFFFKATGLLFFSLKTFSFF